VSGLGIAAVVLLSLWLGALTLAVLLLIRQIGLITVRLDVARSGRDDGLGIGDRVPTQVLAALPELEHGLVYLLFLSPSCGPCLEIVPELGSQDFEAPVIALFGGRDEMADDFEATFPSEIRTMRDPIASEVADTLKIRSTPFAIEIETGIVTGKTYMREAADLVRLMAARETSEAAEIAHNLREVVETGG